MEEQSDEPKLVYSAGGDATTIEVPATVHAGVAAERYLRKEFFARGGMGEIWISQDVRLGREVALKTLHDTHDRARERFLTEAQVTGQLEHPGVVPLHDMGVNENGQPFYVMKLVRGRSLKQAIAEYHSETPGDVPRQVQRLGLLKIFLDLCHVVAYAHSRGVLHRDLKPDNVVLGEYGETILLDWGLAKVRGQPESVGGSAPIQLSGSVSTTHTEAGSIMGSLLYMSPEMAEGRAADTNERTDVYLLGATLYEMLTGRAPREGRSRDEILELARSATPTKPRRIRADIAGALEAVCVKAMAHRQEDRYASALALADDVQRFLAGEPVSVYPEGVAARLWRWSRRHRAALVRTGVGAVMLVVAAAAARGVHQASQLRQREDARRQVAQFDALADEALFYAANTNNAGEHAPYFDPQKARHAGAAALAVADDWGPSVDRLPLIEERQRLRGDEYELLLLLGQEAAAREPYDGQEAQLGGILSRAAALNVGLTSSYHNLCADLAHLEGREGRGADEAAQRKMTQDATLAMTAFDWFLVGEGRRTATAPGAGDELTRRGSPGGQQAALTAAMDAYRSALGLDPKHYWSHYQLARCYMAMGREAQAIEAFGACIALRPGTAWAYSARGMAYGLEQQFGPALADVNHALVINPQFRPALLNRGVIERLAGNIPAALADFTAALAPPDENALPEAAYYRAQVNIDAGAFERAHEDLDYLLIHRSGFGPAYTLRARLDFLRHEPAAAVESINTLLTLDAPHGQTGAQRLARRGQMLRALAADLPAPAARQALDQAARDLQAAIDQGAPSAAMYGELGAASDALGDMNRAIAAYSKALALDPADARIRLDRAWALQMQNRLAESRGDFEEILAQHESDAQAHAGLGFILACQNQLEDARQQAAQALLYGDADYVALHNAACIFARISDVEPQRRAASQDAAIAILRRAVDVWRRDGVGPDETMLIRNESAFSADMRKRTEFRQLIEGPPAVIPRR